MEKKELSGNINEKKELLEKQLKELNDLRAQILKSNKEIDKKDELNKLNQDIAKIEKELLKIKLQELKDLKNQIVLPEHDSKKIETKLSNFENLFSSLENKIDSMDAKNQELFEKQKAEVEKNFEELQKEIAEAEKLLKEILSGFQKEIIAQQVQELLPEHNKKANENRAQAVLSLEEEMKVKEGENPIANRAAKWYQKIMKS